MWKVPTIRGTHFSLNHDYGRKGRFVSLVYCVPKKYTKIYIIFQSSCQKIPPPKNGWNATNGYNPYKWRYGPLLKTGSGSIDLSPSLVFVKKSNPKNPQGPSNGPSNGNSRSWGSGFYLFFSKRFTKQVHQNHRGTFLQTRIIGDCFGILLGTFPTPGERKCWCNKIPGPWNEQRIYPWKLMRLEGATWFPFGGLQGGPPTSYKWSYNPYK